MLRVIVGFALCAGCYSPTIAPGAPCETSCPGDLVCIDNVCRERGYMPGVDAPPMADAYVPIDTLDAPPDDEDADGDGVDDSADNCPALANADQHDEDGDAIGDVCDPCPHLAGTDADADGDGVGDACDPQPSIAKQRIRFFDPFTSNLPEWTHASGITRAGDTLRINAGNSGAASKLSIPNAETRFYVGGTIVAVSNTTPRQVSLDFGASSTSVYHYGEFWDPGDAKIEITKRNQSNYSSLAATDVGGPLPTGSWTMRIDGSVAAQRIQMASTIGGMSYPTLVGNTSTSPQLAAGSYVTLFVKNLEVRVDYFVVIETLP